MKSIYVNGECCSVRMSLAIWILNALITHIVWCDICRVVIIHNQHFPQCLQANAVVCCVFEMIIGPGHWMGGNWSHYPIMWITVNECRYLRQISSNHRICLLTIIRLSNTYKLMQTVHLWYVSHQTVLAFVWCTSNTCYTIDEAVSLSWFNYCLMGRVFFQSIALLSAHYSHAKWLVTLAETTTGTPFMLCMSHTQSRSNELAM